MIHCIFSPIFTRILHGEVTIAKLFFYDACVSNANIHSRCRLRFTNNNLLTHAHFHSTLVVYWYEGIYQKTRLRFKISCNSKYNTTQVHSNGMFTVWHLLIACSLIHPHPSLQVQKTIPQTYKNISPGVTLAFSLPSESTSVKTFLRKPFLHSFLQFRASIHKRSEA